MAQAKPLMVGLMVFLLLVSSHVSAKWLANIGIGETYNGNFSLQNGNYSNISQSQTSRTGSEISGGLSWEHFSNTGGYSVDIRGLLDQDNNTGQQLTNLALLVSRVQALSVDWLLRLNGGLVSYKDESYTANSYDGYSLGATLGYLDQQSSGFDITLNFDDENHNQDPNALYQLSRLGVKAIYFFSSQPEASRFNILLGVEAIDSNDNRRDASSVLASINWENVRFGNNQAIFSLSWRRDGYKQGYSITQSDQMSSYSSMQPNYNYFSGVKSGQQARVDNQYYLTVTVQRPLTQSLRGSLSANAGGYSSATGQQTFANVYARLRWYFQ